MTRWIPPGANVDASTRRRAVVPAWAGNGLKLSAYSVGERPVRGGATRVTCRHGVSRLTPAESVTLAETVRMTSPPAGERAGSYAPPYGLVVSGAPTGVPLTTSWTLLTVRPLGAAA